MEVVEPAKWNRSWVIQNCCQHKLWHNYINAFLLSLGFTQSSATANLYHCRDGILILLYIVDISMVYLEAAAKAVTEVKGKVLQKYNITNFGPAHQFLAIKIYHDEFGTRISLSLKGYITTILRQFGAQHSQDVSMPPDTNVRKDLAEDQGEKELDAMTDYHAAVKSRM